MKRPFGVSAVDPNVNAQVEYTVASYKGCLDRIARHGFGYAEYSHVDHLTEADAAEIGEHADKLGVVSHSVHGEGHIKKYGKERFFEIQDICARNAARMGCEKIVFHLPYPEGTPTYEENFPELARLAEVSLKWGVTPCLENGPTDLVLDLLRDLNIPEFKFILDTGHAFKDGVAPDAAARKASALLCHTHIADNFGVTDDHLPPGIGLIDWAAFYRALQDIGYRDILMVELTGKYIKRKRVVPSLRELDLDLEMNVAISTLNILWDKFGALNKTE